MIVHKTLDKKDPLLKEKLEEKLKANPNDTKFLYALIFLNSLDGLKRFRELTKEKMKPADESTGLADSATEMLSHFSNIDALADFGELRKILFTDGFEDRRFFGLWNGLYRAYSNLAEIDYEKVRAHLSEAVLSENISDEEKNFCNTLLEQLRQRQNAIRKETRTLRELKSLLKAHSAS